MSWSPLAPVWPLLRDQRLPRSALSGWKRAATGARRPLPARRHAWPPAPLRDPRTPAGVLRVENAENAENAGPRYPRGRGCARTRGRGPCCALGGTPPPEGVGRPRTGLLSAKVRAPDACCHSSLRCGWGISWFPNVKKHLFFNMLKSNFQPKPRETCHTNLRCDGSQASSPRGRRYYRVLLMMCARPKGPWLCDNRSPAARTPGHWPPVGASGRRAEADQHCARVGWSAWTAVLHTPHAVAVGVVAGQLARRVFTE